MPTLPSPLRGIIVPLVTPLANFDELDAPGLERLVEHVIAGGVHGIFVLGTTGEGPSLSYRIRREIISAVCKQVANRIPVLVGITDTAFAESVAMAQHAEKEGASAVVVAPPPYFSTSQEELLGYFQRIAAAVPLPVLLYNMPVHTKVFIEAATVVAAADIPGIVGFKDSSGNMSYFHLVQELLAVRSDFSLLVGPEELLAETVLLGGHGGVNGGANLAPELYVGSYEAAVAGELVKVRFLHQKIMQLSRLLYSVGGRGSSMLTGLKCALHQQGICCDGMAEPFRPFGLKERQIIEANLRELKLAPFSSDREGAKPQRLQDSGPV